MWHATKAVLVGKSIALNTYVKGEERSKTNYPSFYLKRLEERAN